VLTRGTSLPARRHYGQEIVSTVLGEPVESPVVEQLWLKMYGDFVEALDGIDNGVAQYVTSEPPRYRSRTDLSSRVGNLNPRWNEPMTDDILIDGFNKATELCGSEFLARLDYLHKAWLPARDIVVRAVESRKDVHPSGKVIVFTEFCPWKVRLSLTLSRSTWRRPRDRALTRSSPARRSTFTSSRTSSRSPRTSSRSTSCTRRARSPTQSGASRPSPSRPSRSTAARRFPRRASSHCASSSGRLICGRQLVEGVS